MSDAEMDNLVERIAEAVARRLKRSQRRAPAGYWSLSDVAEWYGRSESWVRRMMYAGRIPAPDIGGGKGATMAWRAEAIKGAKVL